MCIQKFKLHATRTTHAHMCIQNKIFEHLNVNSLHPLCYTFLRPLVISSSKRTIQSSLQNIRSALSDNRHYLNIERRVPI